MTAETGGTDLNRVSETLLIPLYYRALETQRPDAMIVDEKAVALVREINYDFERIASIPLNEASKIMRIMLTREMDRYARDFLARSPDGVVIHLGCGLDTRFERVDNGQAVWFDLDLPEVIALRRGLFGGKTERYHLLGCSMFESAWHDVVRIHTQTTHGQMRACLFLAEGVFMYFQEDQIRRMALRLRDRFPGSELVFDVWTPLQIRIGNLLIAPSRFSGLFHWGVWRSQEIEGWGEGIHLLDEWGYFDRPEPRLARFRWMAPFFRLLKPMRVFHFQLG